MLLIDWSSASVSISKSRSFGSLLVWSFQLRVNKMPSRNHISNELRQAVVAAIKLGSIIRTFPNNVRSIVLHCWRFTSRRYSRQLSTFPGVNIRANSPQGQTMQWSEKLQTTQELHLRLMVDYEVCGSTIRKWPDNITVSGRVQKLLLSKKNKSKLCKP